MMSVQGIALKDQSDSVKACIIKLLSIRSDLGESPELISGGVALSRAP
jgi:hypothetical protein